ncbi:MAG: mandelate racemase/muconate lactonizing enzyme family protein [Pirellulaceae bacterium]
MTDDERIMTVKIERVEAYPLRYPMTGFFKFFAGPQGATGRAAVIVKITADDGTVGWGQSVPVEKWSYETLEASTGAIRDYYGPALIGHNPADIIGAHRIMDQTIYGGFSTGMPITRAGIDLALHDLTGRLLGQSLCEMWNRPRGGPVTLSWTVNARTLAEAEQVMHEGEQRGYRHFNIKVAPDPQFDVELARLARRAAPAGFLWADANGGYDPPTALVAAARLADVGVDVLEAPIRPNQISGYQALKRQGALPILMDEGVVAPVELEEFIRLKMLDGVAVKPSRCGGLISNKRQIEIIEREGLMWLGSGLTDPDISLAAALGLYAAFALQKPAALNGPQFLTADVLKTPLQIVDGKAHVPSGPGLGVEIDEEKLARLIHAGTP